MIWQRAIQIASATDIPEQQFELNFNMKKNRPDGRFFCATLARYGLVASLAASFDSLTKLSQCTAAWAIFVPR